MSPSSRFVSATTYFDLPNSTFDDFTKELSYLHGTMQKEASGDASGQVTRFEGQVWWYHIKKTGPTTVGDDDLWICLEDATVYHSMVDNFCNTCRDEGTVLEVTNNLDLIASNGFLSPLHYPNHALSTPNGQIYTQASTPIFPVLFAIKPTYNVHFPDMLSLRKAPLLLQSHPLQETQRPTPRSSDIPQSSSYMTRARPSLRPTRPLILIERPASDIARRYSIPFDVLVIGLNGGNGRRRRPRGRRNSVSLPIRE